MSQRLILIAASPKRAPTASRRSGLADGARCDGGRGAACRLSPLGNAMETMDISCRKVGSTASCLGRG